MKLRCQDVRQVSAENELRGFKVCWRPAGIDCHPAERDATHSARRRDRSAKQVELFPFHAPIGIRHGSNESEPASTYRAAALATGRQIPNRSIL